MRGELRAWNLGGGPQAAAGRPVTSLAVNSNLGPAVNSNLGEAKFESGESAKFESGESWRRPNRPSGVQRHRWPLIRILALPVNSNLGGAKFQSGKYGPKRGRTADLYTASVALYQLSYGPAGRLPIPMPGRDIRVREPVRR